MSDVREFSAQLVQVWSTINRIRRLKRNSEQAAQDCMRELLHAGLLVGSPARKDPREDAANLLQARMPWRAAEAIAAELDEAGLLAPKSN